MSYSRRTPNYELPQYDGTDKPAYLTDFNTAMSTIDGQMKNNADAAAAASAKSGTLADLQTSAKNNLVAAVNEVNVAATAAEATAQGASATAQAASENAATALAKVEEPVTASRIDWHTMGLKLVDSFSNYVHTSSATVTLGNIEAKKGKAYVVLFTCGGWSNNQQAEAWVRKGSASGDVLANCSSVVGGGTGRYSGSTGVMIVVPDNNMTLSITAAAHYNPNDTTLKAQVFELDAAA